MTRPTENIRTVVEDLLADGGHGQDEGLRRALLSLASLASLPAPKPTGELAVLLGTSADAAGQEPANAAGIRDDRPGDELARRRRLRGHRPTVVGLALIAGMGMGVTGVAASSTAPGAPHILSIQQLFQDWAPSWGFSTGNTPPNTPESQAAAGHTDQATEPAATETDSGAGDSTAPAGGQAQQHPARPQVPGLSPSHWPTWAAGVAPRDQDAAKGHGQAEAAPDTSKPETGGGQGSGEGPAQPAEDTAEEGAVLSPGTPAPLQEAARQGSESVDNAAARTSSGLGWLQKLIR